MAKYDYLNNYLNSNMNTYKGGGMFTTYNVGGTHEQNPNGGIPLGKDASVEQGETSVNLNQEGAPTQNPTGSKYIFSDRQVWTPEDLKMAGLPATRKPVTAGEYMAKLNEKFSGRAGSKPDKETLDTFTKRATQLAEQKRMQKEQLERAMQLNSQQVAPENTEVPEGMEQFYNGGEYSRYFNQAANAVDTSAIKAPTMPGLTGGASGADAASGATSGSLGNAGAYIQAAGTVFDMYQTAKTGNTSTNRGKAIGGGAAKGAISGASIGTTFMPGIGTAIGAVGGAVVGGVSGYLGSNTARKKEAQAQSESIAQVNAGMPNANAWTGVASPTQGGVVSAHGGYIKSRPYAGGGYYADGGETDPTYYGGELKEVVVKGKPKGFWKQSKEQFIKEHQDDSLLGALGSVVTYPLGLPQQAMMYATTGKVQAPSEALDIKNPYGAMAADMAIDPLNLVGAGVLGDVDKMGRLIKQGKYLGAGKTVLGSVNKVINPLADIGSAIRRKAKDVAGAVLPFEQKNINKQLLEGHDRERILQADYNKEGDVEYELNRKRYDLYEKVRRNRLGGDEAKLKEIRDRVTKAENRKTVSDYFKTDKDGLIYSEKDSSLGLRTGSGEIIDLETGTKHSISAQTPVEGKRFDLKGNEVVHEDLVMKGPEVSPEYIPTVKKNIDFVEKQIPGAKVFGSARNVAEGKVPHLVGDYDVIMSKPEYEEFAKQNRKVGTNGFAQVHELPGSANREKIDINIIDEENGKATGKRAQELFRQIAPDEFFEASKEAIRVGGDIKIPYSSKELIAKTNPSSKSVVDAYESVKDKHLNKIDALINYGDPKVVKEGQEQYLKGLVGSKGTVGHQFPIEDLGDVNQNMEILNDIGFIGNKRLAAENPERMQLALNDYYINNSVLVRQVTEGTNEKIEAAAKFYSPESGGGSANGIGQNHVMLGDPHHDNVTAVKQIGLKPDTSNPRAYVDSIRHQTSGEQIFNEDERALLSNIVDDIKDLGSRHDADFIKDSRNTSELIERLPYNNLGKEALYAFGEKTGRHIAKKKSSYGSSNFAVTLRDFDEAIDVLQYTVNKKVNMPASLKSYRSRVEAAEAGKGPKLAKLDEITANKFKALKSYLDGGVEKADKRLSAMKEEMKRLKQDVTASADKLHNRLNKEEIERINSRKNALRKQLDEIYLMRTELEDRRKYLEDLNMTLNNWGIPIGGALGAGASIYGLDQLSKASDRNIEERRKRREERKIQKADGGFVDQNMNQVHTFYANGGFYAAGGLTNPFPPTKSTVETLTGLNMPATRTPIAVPAPVVSRPKTIDDLYSTYNSTRYPKLDSLVANDMVKKTGRNITLTEGRSKGRKVDTAVLNAIDDAERRHNLKRGDLASLVKREEDFKLEPGSSHYDLRDMANYYKVNETVSGLSPLQYLADRKVPGVKVIPTKMKLEYERTDDEQINKYLAENPRAAEKYERLLRKSVPNIGTQNTLDFIAKDMKRFKNKADFIKDYNPGDPNYSRMVAEDAAQLAKEKEYNQYLDQRKRKRYDNGGPRPAWFDDIYPEGLQGTMSDSQATQSLANMYKTGMDFPLNAKFGNNEYPVGPIPKGATFANQGLTPGGREYLTPASVITPRSGYSPTSTAKIQTPYTAPEKPSTMSTIGKYAGQAAGWLDENKNSLLRAYPILSNIIERDKIRKPAGHYGARLNDAYNIPVPDEAAPLRDINAAYNNKIRALGQMGGSQGQQRAALLGLGAQENQLRSQTYAGLENARMNRAMQEQQFKSQIAQYNAAKSDQDRDLMDRDTAKYDELKSRFTSQIAGDIGQIGLEQDRMDQVANMYGYTRKGKYLVNNTTGKVATPEELSKIRASMATKEETKTAAFGGYITRKPSKY